MSDQFGNERKERAPSTSVNIPDDDKERLLVQLGWKDLKLVVKDRADGSDKTILHGLSGSVRWGEMMMVIGPSGSGKTSFLNSIGALTVGDVTGDILFNGRPRPENAKRFVGIVPQDDVFFNSLTVRESLTFSAKLKLPFSMSSADKAERVSRIIDELDLERCADTRIGEIGQGISGGERRRLSIAMELIHEPSVLLLDEPTTGLDSASALLIGKILRRLSDHKQVTIIATIHQPRLGLAQMFDKMYFLANGLEMYQGPVDPDLMPYLESAGYKPPRLENPLDFVLDLVNTSEVDESVRESRDVVLHDMNKFYVASAYHERAQDMSLPDNFNTDAMFATIESQPTYITPWYNQFYVIAVRTFIFKLREPAALMTQLFSAVFMSVIFGSIYWQIDNSFQSQLDRTSAVSLTILMMAFETFDILMLFPMERVLLNRECDAGLYGSLAYFLGRTTSEIPVHTLMGLLAATITYFMFGLHPGADRFLVWASCCALAVNAGASMLMLCSALAKDIEQSNMLATMIMVFMLFDGNWISLDKIPVYYRWINTINFIGYASHAALVNEYRGLTFACTAHEANIGVCAAGQTETGSQILGQRGLEHVNIQQNLWLLVALTVAYRFLAFIAMVFCYRTNPPKIKCW